MKKIISIAIALLPLLIFCACGKSGKPEESGTSAALTETEGEAASSSAAEMLPQQSSQSGASAGSEEPGERPEEDPWAEGYYYDEELSRALWDLFATENTNDTDESRISCTMTQDFLEELNRRAHAWLYDGLTDSETEHAMLALSFRFPKDPPDTQRGMKSAKAGIYSLKGRDPGTLAARIRLGNTEACFYLFLRAYYSPAEERTRVYMINGLVW